MSIPEPPNLYTPIASNFIPQAQLIVAITNAVNAAATTQYNHGYYTGLWVRITVPLAYGMSFYYSQTQIVVTGATTFITNIDTSNLLPFVAPTFTGLNPFTPAQAVPMAGETANIAPTTGVYFPPKPPPPLPPPYFGPPVFEPYPPNPEL